MTYREHAEEYLRRTGGGKLGMTHLTGMLDALIGDRTCKVFADRWYRDATGPSDPRLPELQKRARHHARRYLARYWPDCPVASSFDEPQPSSAPSAKKKGGFRKEEGRRKR